MFCTRCGAQNDDPSQFCQSCGHSVRTDSLLSPDIRISELPEICTSRIRAALKNPPGETFLINESKLGWALIWLGAAVMAMLIVATQANGYKWQSQEIVTQLFLTVVAFVVGWASLWYVIRWLRSAFKPCVLVNPLYFLRLRFGKIQAISLPTAIWNVTHLKDSHGAYAGTRFQFRGDGKICSLKIKSIRAANELVGSLNELHARVADLLQRQDFRTLYGFDFLYEWRQREETFPGARNKKPGRSAYVLAKLGSVVAAGTIATLVFTFAVLPYNDRRDDDIRWQSAVNAGTATAYRLYLASRKYGRHSADAFISVESLYDRAADNYRSEAGAVSSPGIEAVIDALNYAKRTGDYRVVVQFSGDNEIPEDIDARMRAAYRLVRVVPILPSFTAPMNQQREARILERVSASFGRIIPGDILRFQMGQPTPQEISFDVKYTITASGDPYYPVDEEKLMVSDRDWYTGISFYWKFSIAIPDSASAFHFSLHSQPAQLFTVGYQRAVGNNEAPSSTEVYNAMADSAFDDFGSKLLSELSVRQR